MFGAFFSWTATARHDVTCPISREMNVSTYTIAQINALPKDEFVRVCGHLFEHSPWVAQKAADKRPFADRGDMHRKLFSMIEESPEKVQIDFLRAHPELAGKEAQQGSLTRDSTSEQARAGLDALSPAELAEIGSLNRDYRKNHGFPFIACVKHYTKAGIFHEFRRRVNRDTGEELETALEQIRAITGFRLADLVGD